MAEGDEFYGGVIAKIWNDGQYILRDDLNLRKDDPFFADCKQAYSLFVRGLTHYSRVVVFGGSLEWALPQAEKLVQEGAT